MIHVDLGERVLAGDKRAAARLITMVENKEPAGIDILRSLFGKTGRAYVIGVTGPPGAGKSTLTDKLVKHVRSIGKTAAVIAVDPTSPFTGGAILGDRVRMSEIATDRGVFIRSMGARGHLGGISEATGAAIKILDLYGADYIFVETVGVGQSEVDIVKICDTTLMVMVPGLGDDIQAIKAGIMEIGDVFCVNKADRDGARRTARELNAMLDFNHAEWRPPVELVIAIHGKGIEELFNHVEAHRVHTQQSGLFNERRVSNAKNEIVDLAKEKLLAHLFDEAHREEKLHDLAEKVARRAQDPYTARDLIYEELIGGDPALK